MRYGGGQEFGQLEALKEVRVPGGNEGKTKLSGDRTWVTSGLASHTGESEHYSTGKHGGGFRRERPHPMCGVKISLRLLSGA